MNVNDLCDLIARETGLHFVHVQLHARRLREAGYMPQGSRGRTAPPVEPKHAAALLIALVATEVARQAPSMVEHYNLGVKRLALALADGSEAHRLESLILRRTHSEPTVRFIWDQGRPSHPLPESYVEHLEKEYWMETVGGELPTLYPSPSSKGPTFFVISASLEGGLFAAVHDAMKQT